MPAATKESEAKSVLSSAQQTVCVPLECIKMDNK
jgi:hypothetical protein